MGRRLVARGFTLALAESCTGGLVGHRLTNIPGSSAFFERGMVVYSNRAKEEMLGVPAEVLRVHGAVSRPCAEAMVRGACERSGAACGLAITGYRRPRRRHADQAGRHGLHRRRGGRHGGGAPVPVPRRSGGGEVAVVADGARHAPPAPGRPGTPIATVRAFVAILLAGRGAGGDWPRPWTSCGRWRSDVVWVGPDSFHLTLKFLGAVDADRLGALTETLTSAAAACAPFQLGIRGLGAFASPARPRVLWAGIEAGRGADGGPRQRVSTRRWRRSASSARRARCPLTSRSGACVNPTPSRAWPRRWPRPGIFGTVDVTRVSLMRSDLSSRGARYTELAAAPLARVAAG